MQIFVATLGIILGFVGLHAHLLGLSAVPSHAFPGEQQTGSQKLVQVNTLTPAFLFLLSFSTEKTSVRHKRGRDEASAHPIKNQTLVHGRQRTEEKPRKAVSGGARGVGKRI
jgi:hypothetical protein